ncbi:Fic family protein [Saccharopolyspora pogona]|uniref:Fic family protein n=1 Tax=Saccharopolyspora pogona TaxID=333966 RepID=UPI0016888AD6|nr:Fic/DOC family N-terminal domain-containing protein [Saccharopolyspora pogona]
MLRSRTHRAAATAEQALGRLDEAAQRLPDRAAVVRATQLRGVQNSAGIDGVYAALHEVLLQELPGLQDTSGVPTLLRCYMEASDHASGALERGRPLDVTLLGELSALMAHDKAGKTAADKDAYWRRDHSWLGGPAEQAWLLCTPPGPHLHAAAAQWSTWANGECELPLVGQIAIGYYQFEVLRPFAVGSGHLARLYIGLELMRSGALRDQVLPVSAWFDRHHEEYCAQLRRVVETGLWDDWVVFIAEAIRQQCGEQIRLISELERLRSQHLAHIGSGGSVRQVAAGLIGHPVTNHRQIAQRYGISLKSATEVCRRLVASGILSLWKHRRYRKVFICPEMIDLLTCNEPFPPEADREVFTPAP